jgi:hypothetical protein
MEHQAKKDKTATTGESIEVSVVMPCLNKDFK